MIDDNEDVAIAAEIKITRSKRRRQLEAGKKKVVESFSLQK